MCPRKLCLPAITFAALFLAANLVWGLGFELGETKEQLQLKYEVSSVDHGTGRVTVTLTIADEGRLKPLTSVDLVIRDAEGSGYVDLSVPLARSASDGKQEVRVHMKRELAERAAIHLKTSTLDGKQQPLTWYYHSIPFAKHMPKDDEKKDGR